LPGSHDSLLKCCIPDSYEDRSVTHIDLIYFLSQIIGHNVYDDIWIDAEGAEYEMFPYFYRGGKLDQNGITLCQFNLEVSSFKQKALKKYNSSS
ncbi:hypothetical protein OESDEN_12750, partial [Oesophagostomum dentatum]